MTKEHKKKKDEKSSLERFLQKIPSKLPFVPGIRRPDYQLRKIRLGKHRKFNATIIIALMILGSVYILVGGFYYASQDENYAIVEHPRTHKPTPIWMLTLHDQTLFEGAAVGILIFIGAGGFYLIHQASHYAYTPTTALKFLCIGIGLALLALLAVTILFLYKIGVFDEVEENVAFMMRAVFTA
jgi:hypothetical protein